MNVKESNLIKVCPACGYSFKNFDKNKLKNIKKCPRCGYKFSQPKIQPTKEDFFQKRI
jgi:protein-arginine kinase activator protein McsA